MEGFHIPEVLVTPNVLLFPLNRSSTSLKERQHVVRTDQRSQLWLQFFVLFDPISADYPCGCRVAHDILCTHPSIRDYLCFNYSISHLRTRLTHPPHASRTHTYLRVTIDIRFVTFLAIRQGASALSECVFRLIRACRLASVGPIELAFPKRADFRDRPMIRYLKWSRRSLTSE